MASASSSSPFFGVREDEHHTQVMQQQSSSAPPPQAAAPVKKRRSLPGNPCKYLTCLLHKSCMICDSQRRMSQPLPILCFGCLVDPKNFIWSKKFLETLIQYSGFRLIRELGIPTLPYICFLFLYISFFIIMLTELGVLRLQTCVSIYFLPHVLCMK